MSYPATQRPGQVTGGGGGSSGGKKTVDTSGSSGGSYNTGGKTTTQSYPTPTPKLYGVKLTAQQQSQQAAQAKLIEMEKQGLYVDNTGKIVSQSKPVAAGDYRGITSQQVAGRKAVKEGRISEVFGSSLGVQAGERLLPPSGGGVIRNLPGHSVKDVDLPKYVPDYEAGAVGVFQKAAESRARVKAALATEQAARTIGPYGTYEQTTAGGEKMSVVSGGYDVSQLKRIYGEDYGEKVIVQPEKVSMARYISSKGILLAGTPKTKTEEGFEGKVYKSEKVGGRAGEYRVVGMESPVFKQSIWFGAGGISEKEFKAATGYGETLVPTVKGLYQKVSTREGVKYVGIESYVQPIPKQAEETQKFTAQKMGEQFGAVSTTVTSPKGLSEEYISKLNKAEIQDLRGIYAGYEVPESFIKSQLVSAGIQKNIYRYETEVSAKRFGTFIGGLGGIEFGPPGIAVGAGIGYVGGIVYTKAKYFTEDFTANILAEQSPDIQEAFARSSTGLFAPAAYPLMKALMPGTSGARRASVVYGELGGQAAFLGYGLVASKAASSMFNKISGANRGYDSYTKGDELTRTLSKEGKSVTRGELSGRIGEKGFTGETQLISLPKGKGAEVRLSTTYEVEAGESNLQKLFHPFKSQKGRPEVFKQFVKGDVEGWEATQPSRIDILFDSTKVTRPSETLQSLRMEYGESRLYKVLPEIQIRFGVGKSISVYGLKPSRVSFELPTQGLRQMEFVSFQPIKGESLKNIIETKRWFPTGEGGVRIVNKDIELYAKKHVLGGESRLTELSSKPERFIGGEFYRIKTNLEAPQPIIIKTPGMYERNVVGGGLLKFESISRETPYDISTVGFGTRSLGYQLPKTSLNLFPLIMFPQGQRAYSTEKFAQIEKPKELGRSSIPRYKEQVYVTPSYTQPRIIAGLEVITQPKALKQVGNQSIRQYSIPREIQIPKGWELPREIQTIRETQIIREQVPRQMQMPIVTQTNRQFQMQYQPLTMVTPQPFADFTPWRGGFGGMLPLGGLDFTRGKSKSFWKGKLRNPWEKLFSFASFKKTKKKRRK